MAFRCVIVTPEQQVLDESATQAIVPAWDGQIGILTDRAPLLVKLGMGRLRIDVAGGQRREFVIDGGIAQMKDNNLTLLTDDAVAADEIDLEAARAELGAAEAKVPTDTKSTEERLRQIRKAKLKQEMAGKA